MNKINVLKNIVVLFAAVMAIPAIAAGTFSNWGKISQTYTHGAWTLVKITGEGVNPDGECESRYYYGLDVSDPNYDGILSSILSAHMAGKSVRFWLNGCAGQGNKYPHIISIQVSS